MNYCVNGVFETIQLDDHIPVGSDGRAKFATSQTNCLWPLFLEKASAKVYGAYWNIGGAGAPSRALNDLTGAPTEFFKTDKYSADELFNKIVDADKKKYIIVSPTLNDPNKLQKDKGIVAHHAYTIVGAYILGNEKVLKMRNPHGKNEWTGDWSDESSKWTPAYRKQVRMESNEDGTFYMPLHSFKRNFQEVSVCHYRPDYVKCSLKMEQFYLEGLKGFRIQIETPGNYYIAMNKPDERFEDVPKFEYTTMIMFKQKGENFEYVGGKAHSERDYYFQADLSAGAYLLFVRF